MSKFRDFAQTISAKLYGVFVLLSGAVVAVALISLINAHERSAVDARMAETSASLRYIDQVNALIYAVVMDSRGVYMSPDSKSAAGYAKGIRQFSQQILDILVEWRKVVKGDDAEAFKTLEARLLQFVEFRRKLAQLSDNVSTTSAREWGDNEANRSVRRALNGDMEALAKVYATRTAVIKEEIAAAGQRATALYSVALALAVALAGLGIFVVSRQVLHPLTRLRTAMGRLADGDFTAVLPNLDRRDEIGELARAVDSIKVKSADREQAKAAEKARQERAAQEQQRTIEQRAALEQEKAQAALMAKFDEAVGSVVQAAAQGRFDVRVPLADKSGVLLSLAENLNAMCAMIESALADIGRVVEGLASGDLRQKISAEYTGTFGELKTSINNTVDRLNAIVGGINDGVSEVTSAAGEVAGATTDLSQRTEEQASSIESTSSALREITAAVQRNAASAQTTSASAADAQKAASHGSAVVSDAIEAMGRIAASSDKISNIIGVIDEIARQTNLLALNAAVESARAGEAGRSFGVVASEVRALAQRSSEAAKAITALITQSNEEVRAGADLTQRAGSALNEILTAVRSVSDIANGVAASSQNQAATIGQIEASLAKIERSTQQNSAIVEQNAAAAKTLEMQADQMSASVAFFKMDRSASGIETDTAQRDAA